MATDASVGVIPVYRSNDGLLYCLIQHAAGYWGFPKGHQDAGESPHETTIRELGEETGIHGAELDTLRVFRESYTFQMQGITYDKTVEYYIAHVASTNNATPAAFKAEIPDMRWLPYDAALALIREQSKPLLVEAKEYLESTA